MVYGCVLRVQQMITQTVRKFPGIALTITMLSTASACSTQSLVETSDRRVETVSVIRGQDIGQRAANVAMQQVGVPYLYGGSTTSGFDCSGLVQFSYGRVGKTVPRTTGQLWAASATIKRADLRAGDLLFFSIEGKMSHVGMFVGGQKFVHAPSSGRTVTVASLTSPFYSSALIRAGRPK